MVAHKVGLLVSLLVCHFVGIYIYNRTIGYIYIYIYMGIYIYSRTIGHILMS